ncbi:MAG: acetyltransferase [Verrucomicrobiales bacterium]|jgi:GNAT superfamily N-acetyltransferase|nr:acetyltransferase [Verrucomicrobiales bacterium]
MKEGKTDDNYQIDEDIARIDFARVHSWLTTSYWSPGISREWVERAARHSALVLGVYSAQGQVGYLRVVSDRARLAYLCDVWIDSEHRGKGLGRLIVRYALEHPELARVKWILATADAHGVYANLGFKPLSEPQRWMERASTASLAG